jgi:type VI secretion system protein ImpJ
MNRPIPDLIQWHEGLLLTPQHFQQLSLRMESQVQTLPGLFVPFGWGVRTFEYDTADFSIGVLTVTALDVVMPDGCHVVLSPSRDVLQADLRPLANRLRKRPLRVHLAMPLSVGHMPDAVVRFSSYPGEPVADANTGDGSIVIPRLRPRLSLMLDDQPPARYTSFPLIEVRCEGESYLPTAFVPPTLQVVGSSPLGRKCAQVAERIRMKAADLAEGAILSPQSRSGAEARSQLHLLACALPPLEALLRTDCAHPFTLYLELCRLAGQVAVLGNSLVPPLFPAYLHNDPAKGFDQVTQFITRSVEEGLPETVHRFAFAQQDELFRLVNDPGWADAFRPGAKQRAVLAIRSAAADDLTLEWGRNCIIGGAGEVESLLARRVLGLERRFVDAFGDVRPPHGIHLFALTADAESIQAGEDLLVLGSSAGVRPEALYLYIFDGDSDSGGANAVRS